MITEILAPDTGSAVAALRTLRPSWTDDAQLIRHIDGVLRPQGYRLIGSFEDAASPACAVAGIRLADSLAVGRYLYIDDLTTVPTARRRGHARRLLDWLVDEARRLDCTQIHLDSGVGPDRAAAHRAYLNSGYQISAHHFATLVY